MSFDVAVTGNPPTLSATYRGATIGFGPRILNNYRKARLESASGVVVIERFPGYTTHFAAGSQPKFEYKVCCWTSPREGQEVVCCAMNEFEFTSRFASPVQAYEDYLLKWGYHLVTKNATYGEVIGFTPDQVPFLEDAVPPHPKVNLKGCHSDPATFRVDESSACLYELRKLETSKKSLMENKVPPTLSAPPFKKRKDWTSDETPPHLHHVSEISNLKSCLQTPRVPARENASDPPQPPVSAPDGYESVPWKCIVDSWAEEAAILEKEPKELQENKTPDTVVYDGEEDFADSQMPSDSEHTPSEGDDEDGLPSSAPTPPPTPFKSTRLHLLDPVPSAPPLDLVEEEETENSAPPLDFVEEEREQKEEEKIKQDKEFNLEMDKLMEKASSLIQDKVLEEEATEKVRADVSELYLPEAMKRLAMFVLRSPEVDFVGEEELEVQALVELYVTHTHFQCGCDHEGELQRALVTAELDRRSLLRIKKGCTLDAFGYILVSTHPPFKPYAVRRVADTDLGVFESKYVEDVLVRCNPVFSTDAAKKRPIYPPTLSEEESAKVTVERMLCTFLRTISKVTPPTSFFRFLARRHPLAAILKLVRATHSQPSLRELFHCLGDRAKLSHHLEFIWESMVPRHFDDIIKGTKSLCGFKVLKDIGERIVDVPTLAGKCACRRGEGKVPKNYKDKLQR